MDVFDVNCNVLMQWNVSLEPIKGDMNYLWPHSLKVDMASEFKFSFELQHYDS